MLNNVVVMREEGVLDIVNLLITSVTLTNHSAYYVGANRNMLTVSGKPALKEYHKARMSIPRRAFWYDTPFVSSSVIDSKFIPKPVSRVKGMNTADNDRWSIMPSSSFG